jgi:hypothetical protein
MSKSKQNSTQTSAISSSLIGSGTIKITTYESNNGFETRAEYTLDRINTEGAIKELEKIIEVLKKDLILKENHING